MSIWDDGIDFLKWLSRMIDSEYEAALADLANEAPKAKPIEIDPIGRRVAIASDGQSAVTKIEYPDGTVVIKGSDGSVN